MKTTALEGPQLSEGCGGPDIDSQVGNITDPGRATLFFGAVQDSTDRALISQSGKTKKAIEAITGKDNRKYVVGESAEALPESDVVLVDSTGRAVKHADPKAVSK